MNKKEIVTISIIVVILVILIGIFAYLQFNNAKPFEIENELKIVDKIEETEKDVKKEEIPIVNKEMAEWEILEIGMDEQTGIYYQKQYNSNLGITVKIPTSWQISDETKKSVNGTFLTVFAPTGYDVKNGTEMLEEFASVEFIKYKRTKPDTYFVQNLLSDTSSTKIEYKSFNDVIFKSFSDDLYAKKNYYIFMNDIDLFEISSQILFPGDKQKTEKYKVENNFILESLEFDK